MTPVSPHLSRAAWTLLAGAGLATLAANLASGSYYDLVEYRLFDLSPTIIPGRETIPRAVTPVQLVEEIVMAVVMFLLAKEGWEAWRCEKGPFAGAKAAVPVTLALGGMAGGAAVWALLASLAETAEEAQGAPGWVVPMSGDVVLAFLSGRILLGPRSRALQVLLFVTIAGSVIGLVLGGLAAPGGAGLRSAWLVLPVVSAGLGYVVLTRPLQRDALTERARARSMMLLPWAGIAALCWLGVALSGLPPALGFLPLLPAMPHASQSFGLFAAAEEFLTDPLNRVAQALLPVLPVMTGLFGLTHGGLDLGAYATATWVTVAALWGGKTAGILLVTLAIPALRTEMQTPGPARRDVLVIAVLAGVGITGPALLLGPALPGGAVREAARLGLGLSLLVLPVLWGLLRATGRPGGAPPQV
ncbi:MAG: Na+/H+ antiporter NhaA [Gemmobacter sp.]